MAFRDYEGKTIKVRIKNKLVPGEKPHAYIEPYSYIKGLCTFSGFNDVVQEWQVTVNRMPIYPVTDDDIVILNP